MRHIGRPVASVATRAKSVVFARVRHGRNGRGGTHPWVLALKALRTYAFPLSRFPMLTSSHMSTTDSSDTRRIRHLVYGSLQLLLVEDDELQRERLELLLSQANFDVVSVASVQEARSAMEALVFPV